MSGLIEAFLRIDQKLQISKVVNIGHSDPIWTKYK